MYAKREIVRADKLTVLHKKACIPQFHYLIKNLLHGTIQVPLLDLDDQDWGRPANRLLCPLDHFGLVSFDIDLDQIHVIKIEIVKSPHIDDTRLVGGDGLSSEDRSGVRPPNRIGMCSSNLPTALERAML